MSGKLKRYKAVSKNSSKHTRVVKFDRPMLMIDQLILFCLHPGRYQFPDRRCLRRLLIIAQNPKNMLSLVMPDSVYSIIQACKHYNLAEIVKHWWFFNNCSHFFRSNITARLVRVIIKMENSAEEWWHLAPRNVDEKIYVPELSKLALKGKSNGDDSDYEEEDKNIDLDLEDDGEF